MRKNLIVSRATPDAPPRIPLPLYVRSCGRKTLIPGYPEYLPGTRNPFIELGYCVEGMGRFFLYDREFHVQKGSMFYYLPHEDHHLLADSEHWTVLWVTLDGALSLSILGGYEYPRILPVDLSFVRARFDLLFECVPDVAPAAARKACGVALDLLNHAPRTEEKTHSGKLLEAVAGFISDNLSNPELNVNLIADTFQVHRATLNRLFRHDLKGSPRFYIAFRRMSLARALLVGSSLSVSEIALRCGFRDSGVFCRFFKKADGRTPSDYRRNYCSVS